jgi:hypothetical protein
METEATEVRPVSSILFFIQLKNLNMQVLEIT